MTSPLNRPSLKDDLYKIWTWLHRENDRAMAEALAEAARYADSDFDYSIPGNVAASQPRSEPNNPEPYRITRREQQAILRGFYRRSQGESDAWAEVCRCLEAEKVSRDFRRLVARLIEGDILHKRKAGLPALDRENTK